MVKIRFVAQGSNALIGGFSPGDVARVGEAFAHHLVEEARVAEYAERPVVVEDVVTAPPVRRVGRPRKDGT